MTGGDQTRGRLRGPRKLGPYADRDIDCQEAIEADLIAMVDRAEAAGWLRIEAYAALVELIDHHAMADQARELTAETIDSLRRTKS